MRNRYWPLALVLGLYAGMLAITPAPADDKPDVAKIQKLIDQMGSDTFEDREAAAKALGAIGEPALELLRKAVQNGEPEVRKRAEDLVRKIEKAAERNRVLGATKLRLTFKDTPVPEAVAEIQKKTGYNLYLHDPEGKLADRKVTLDTGETTFWNALEQFCQKAGLAEATQQELMRNPGAPRRGGVKGGGGPQPLPAERIPAKDDAKPKDAPKKEEVKEALQPARVAVAAQDKAAPQPVPPPPPPAGPVAAPAAALIQPIFNGQPGQIILTDGKDKEKKEAADVTSAVRVKAGVRSEMFGAAPAGEVLLALEITPEPKLQWQQTMAVRVTKALDDQGQELKEITAAENPGAGPGFGGPGGFVAGPAVRPNVRIAWDGMHQYAPVRLKKGEKAAKVLKELSGTVTAQLLTAPQAVITADNILKSSGKTFKGVEEGSIKILDVSKGENGTVTVRFELEQPANMMPANGGGWGVPGGIQVMPLPAAPRAVPQGALNNAAQAQPAVAQIRANGGVAAGQIQIQVQGQPAIGFAVAGPGGMMVPLAGSNGIALLDGKGNPVPVLVQQQIGWRPVQAGQKNVQEHIFVFQLEKGQSEEMKLVFLGRKQTTIDIPFTLKDVALP
jgi:hypothetical protein